MSSTVTPLTGPTIVKEDSTENPEKRKRGRPRKSAKSTPSQKAKALRTFPTERLTLEKQLEILKAYAAATDNGNRATTAEAVAQLMKIAPSSVRMANSFFTSIGLIQKTDAGFLPAPEVVKFLGAYAWDKETASYKLAPLIESAWFSQTLIPDLRLHPLEEREAITHLAEAAGAGPEYRKQLKVLIDYMAAAGVIQRDGSSIKLAHVGAAVNETAPSDTEERQPNAIEARPGNRLTTGFTQSSEGTVSLIDIRIRVDMTQFSNWPRDRIAAFFAGIAQVLAAKAGVEKEAAS